MIAKVKQFFFFRKKKKVKNIIKIFINEKKRKKRIRKSYNLYDKIQNICNSCSLFILLAF
jgi:hypothetical protein